MIELLAIPFMRHAILAGSLLAAMLAFLGVHVIRRRIVFVDLAIAQLSALGVALGFLVGLDPVLFSMVLTLAGAALLSLPARAPRIPQEALMGIVYAVASAGVILIVAKMPHGDEEIMNLFFGNILAVTAPQIGILFSVFLSVMAVQFVFRRRLAWPEPSGEQSQQARGIWNVVFYLLLALVIAVAIRAGGVLLVFADLIIPAAAAALLTDRMARGVVIAVAMGLAANGLGFYLSFRGDLPSEPTIVVVLGVPFILASIISILRLGSAR